MKVVVVGLWHLGSVTAACLAAAGIETIGLDDDAERVAALARGDAPLYEPGLADLVRAGIAAGRLQFTTDEAVVAAADVVWACHDTPVDDEDRADVDYVTRRIKSLFGHLRDGAVVLVSAQLPVGSLAQLERAYAAGHPGRRVSFACSPENLRLGRAIQVFQNPGRIVVGVRDAAARARLEPLLGRFCDRLIWMSVESAEMVKHALNAFLATSITFTNEIAAICERVGADAAEVEAGLRSDPRIGPNAYVKSGPAFAGGTLARDVNFLTTTAHAHHVVVPVLDGVLSSNRAHAQWALSHLRLGLQPLAGRTVGILGLAYKAGTSSLRRSSAIELIRVLLQQRAVVRAFDPQVTRLPDDLSAVTLVPNALAAAQGADALVVTTEWPEFRALAADDIARMMVGTIVLDPARFLDGGFATHPRLRLISVGRMP
jgi:UDPglucose 6-dehydrogenase